VRASDTWRALPVVAFAALGAAVATSLVQGTPPQPTADQVTQDQDEDPADDPEAPVAIQLPAHAWTSPDVPSRPPLPDPAPALESLRITPAKEPPPTDAEFATARRVSLAYNALALGYNGDDDPHCDARELRGWLRLTCPRSDASVSVLGGSTTGIRVDFAIQEVTITLPLAPGDRRVLQLAHLGRGYDDELEGLVAGGILSEIWLGTRGPHVAMLAPTSVPVF
jgi:hypothetical protein